jgi:signal transduction histidine kinase
VAIEVQLALLLAFADAESVSLWTVDGDAQLRELSHAGKLDGPAAQQIAAALLSGPSPDPDAAGQPINAGSLRIERPSLPAAGLVIIPPRDDAPERQLLLSAAAPDLTMLLDGGPATASESSEESSAESSIARRLARLRYDLHDGPQQDVHLLAQDLALFREQLRPMVSGDPNAGRLLGRLDDLDAQLVALDGDLRRLSTSVESPFLQTGSLVDAMTELAASFAVRTGVDPQVRVQGGLNHLSDSQQITLLALVREALSNIRKHSDASTVQITIVADEHGVHVEVIDDGSGFDPDLTLVSAARAGHLGLVGMHERVRMLGGRTQIESRPGGPTVISATLPPWPSHSS